MSRAQKARRARERLPDCGGDWVRASWKLARLPRKPVGCYQGFGSVGWTPTGSWFVPANLMSTGLSPVNTPAQIARLPDIISTMYLRRRY